MKTLAQGVAAFLNKEKSKTILTSIDIDRISILVQRAILEGYPFEHTVDLVKKALREFNKEQVEKKER